MDLDEWLFFEKKKIPGFTVKQFCKDLDIHVATFYCIKSGQRAPSSKLAYQIEKYTNGKVKGWDLIVKAMERSSCIKKQEN